MEELLFSQYFEDVTTTVAMISLSHAHDRKNIVSLIVLHPRRRVCALMEGFFSISEYKFM